MLSFKTKILTATVFLLFTAVSFSALAAGVKPQIEAGDDFALALLKEGKVLGYGDDAHGQISGAEDWKNVRMIAAGARHSVALFEDGTVAAAGDNAYDQCEVSQWRDIEYIAAGDNSTFAVDSAGQVFAVGRSGEFSTAIYYDGTENQTFPTLSLAVAACKAAADAEEKEFEVVRITASGYNSAALVRVGGKPKVIVHPGNDYSGLISGAPFKLDGYNVSDVSMSDSYITAVTSAKRIIFQGETDITIKFLAAFTGLQNVSRLKANKNFSAALTAAGKMVLSSDELNFGEETPTSWTNLTDIAAGRGSVYGLQSDGTIRAAGLRTGINKLNVNFTLNERPKIGNFQIAAGRYSTAGLKSGGTLLFTGNEIGNIADCANWTDIVQIAMSENGSHIAGLKSNGTVVAAGLNSSAQLAVEDWRNVAQVFASDIYTLGLTRDGRILYAGDEDAFPMTETYARAFINIKKIICGGNYIAGVNYAGAILWGCFVPKNGGAYEVTATSPILLQNTEYDCGDKYALFIKEDGTAEAAIMENGAYLGQQNVGSWSGVAGVSAGIQHSLGFSDSGSLYTAGTAANYSGLDTRGLKTVAVSAGYRHSAIVLEDGTVSSDGNTLSANAGALNTSDWRLIPLRITEMTALEAFDVDFATDFNALNLPQTLTAQSEYGQVELAVEWDATSYNYIVSGEHIVTGTVVPVEDYTWDEGLSGNLSVAVTVGSCLTTEGEILVGCHPLAWGEVEVLQGITTIADGAFENCGDIESFIFPDSLVSIGEGAFKGCLSLVKIPLPEGIDALSANLFDGCASLSEIVLPKSLLAIGAGAFANCPSLEMAAIYGSVSSIEADAFDGSERVVIYGLPGTAAQVFAQDNALIFRPLDYCEADGQAGEGEIGAEARFVNFTEAPYGVKIILVQYGADGAVVSCSSLEKTIPVYDAAADVSAWRVEPISDETAEGGAAEAKLFVWGWGDGLGFSPRCPAKLIPLLPGE